MSTLLDARADDAVATAMAKCNAEEQSRDKVVGGCEWVVWAALEQQPTNPTIQALALRSNFNSFPLASLTVLQLLTKALWPEIMEVARTRFGSIVLIYFYLLIFIGELIILNMTSAVVIVCFRSRSQIQIEDGEAKSTRTAIACLDPLVVRDAAVRQVRTQTRQILIACTGDANWRVRSDATQALTTVGDPGDEACIDVLQLKVGDAHTAVRVNAIEALIKICPAHFAQSYPDVVVAVRKALRDESRFVRQKAASTLAIISVGDAGTIRDLVKATDDPEAMVRIAAITSLGLLAKVNDAYVIRAIMSRIHLAEDETDEVLEAVHTALSILRDMSGQRQEEAKLSLKEELKMATSDQGAKAIDEDYRQNSALHKQEREEQAALVKMIQDAAQVGMFDKDYKLRSTTSQRKHRYRIAADQVEQICEDMREKASRLRQDGMKAVSVMKRNPLYYSMEVCCVPGCVSTTLILNKANL